MTTIITCLYDIRARETRQEEGEEEVRSVMNYLELGKSMLGVDLPMIIYTDSETIKEAIVAIRSDMADKTSVIMLPLEETIFYKDLGAIEEAMKTHSIVNRNKKKDTPLYVILNNNKFDFLERAIAANPFATEYFLWMDFGIQHCAKASPQDWIEVAEKWPAFMARHPDKIHHLRIHTVTKNPNISWKEYFSFIYHHVAGSCFGGRSEKVLEYSTTFQETWHEVLHKEKWYQLDEAIMTIITERFPERFRFWYGDYDGLIVNFLETRRSLPLVFQTAQRHLDARRYEESEKVLQTLDKLMRDDHPEFLRYLQMRICNDFYRWNANYSEALASILMDPHRSLCTGWMSNQIPNLRHYRGNDARRFLIEWSLQKASATALASWREFQAKNKDLLLIAMGAESLGSTSERFPWETARFSSQQLLNAFRHQFQDLPSHVAADADRICRFYELLETPKTPIAFVHVATQSNEDYADLCGYLDRNFPSLEYRLLAILINDPSLPQTSHPRALIFHLHTPFEMESNIRTCLQEFLSAMVLATQSSVINLQ